MNENKALVPRLKNVWDKDPQISRLVTLLIAVFVVMTILKPKFFSIANFASMSNQFPEYGLMALGIMLAMITGGIDLSTVGVANLSSIAAATIILKMIPPDSGVAEGIPGIIVAIVAALFIGAVCGAFNGFLIAKIHIPPILATLGSLELITGVCIIVTQGKPISRLPLNYANVMSAKLFSFVSVPLVIFICVAIGIAYLLDKTVFGTKIYLLGTNAVAAKFSGLRSDILLIKTYMISGVLSSLAGLIMLANYNSAKADYGSTYTLQCVLIVVLGGVNPNGGFGKVIGVSLAIFVLQFLSSGLNMFPDISNFYKPLIWGGVLLSVIVLNYYSGKMKKGA